MGMDMGMGIHEDGDGDGDVDVDVDGDGDGDGEMVMMMMMVKSLSCWRLLNPNLHLTLKSLCFRSRTPQIISYKINRTVHAAQHTHTHTRVPN